MQKTCTPKTLRCWWKKSKMTQPHGKIYCVLRLEESVFSKWLYHPRQSTVLKFVWRHKRPRIGQSNLEKEKWSWRDQALWLQTILQSYSHYYSMLLAQKQKYTSMEQDRKPRNKPMHLWSINLWQRRQWRRDSTIQWKRDSLFNKWCWKTGQLHVRKWS